MPWILDNPVHKALKLLIQLRIIPVARIKIKNLNIYTVNKI